MNNHQFQFAPPKEGAVDILFIAGEHSGDQHAALIAKDIREAHPDWKMAAIGGPSLQREGVQLLHDLTRDSVVGLVEVLKHYGKFKRLFATLVDWISQYRPKVVVLVDYPGFNLRLADALRKKGISRKGGGDVAVFQYVSPQIWAWKAGRRFKMARYLDELGVIFPFELDCYKDTDLKTTFVGHPFARESYVNPVAYEPDGPILLLPGSRKQAVSRIFPLMVETVLEYRKRGGTRSCICLYPEIELRGLLEGILGRMHGETGFISLRHVDTGAMSSVVLTSSGTMSLNCALAGIPGAIVYRAHPLTVWLGRRLVRVEWLGIANLVLGHALYPEYLQQDARPEVLARLIREIEENPDEKRTSFEKGATELNDRLHSEESTTVVHRLEELVG